jgi:peptidoglycan/LPS O-acetylase OafA/YrhL
MASTAAPAALNKLPSLTGLRWLAAFMVFGFHIGTLQVIQHPRPHHLWDLVFGQGASGVSFFFILSGVVLVWSARPTDTKRAFWQRRFAKIFPNHAATWAVVIILMILWGDYIAKKVALANLFLLHTWINRPNYPFSVNTVSWSLGCEAFFYLCLPFALPLLKRARTRTLYVAAAVLPLVIYSMTPLDHLLPASQQAWFIYMAPPVRSFEFWLGAVVGELLVRRAWRGPGLWTSTAVFVGVYTANHWIPDQFHTVDLSIAYTLLIAGAATTDLSGQPSPWRSRPLVWLGEISFAFYLVHVQLIGNTIRYLHGPGIGWSTPHAPFVIAAFLVTAVFLSWLLFTGVEKPMMKLLGPRRRPRNAAPAPARAAPAEVAAPETRTPVPARVSAQPEGELSKSTVSP